MSDYIDRPKELRPKEPEKYEVTLKLGPRGSWRVEVYFEESPTVSTLVAVANKINRSYALDFAAEQMEQHRGS